MIRLAQLYTGGVGSEIIRRLAGHPQLELVAVLVHSDDKAGVDSGTLVGTEPNGIVTTQSIENVLADRPDAAIYSGMLWDADLIAGLLRAGVNVYTGLGGYYLPGQPEFDTLDAAGREGKASLAAGGNIPGLISDVFPLFVSGYTGQIQEIRVWQRNHVSTYPSAVQIQTGLGIGLEPGANEQQAAVDGAWVWAMRQSANMVAAGLGFECTDLMLTDKRIALAKHDEELIGSGLIVKAGTVAGAQWEFAAYSGSKKFLTITNEQTAVLGLGPGWRDNHEEPAWRVEIDGDPPVVATFGWPRGVEPGAANSRLNAARAMNVIPRLVAARPGCVSVLDFPAVVAGDGLASG
jgi:4-hydroxy-tetrahydrodipicolinate reductase